MVECEDFLICGKLKAYDFGKKEKPHKPSLLILDSPQGYLILRGNWFSISKRR